MIHKRDDWTIEISDDPEFRGDRFDVLFDDTYKSGKRCKRFILFNDDVPQSENAILELNIFGSGRVRAWCYEPCMVQVYRRHKVVLIGVCKPWDGVIRIDTAAAQKR